MASYDIILFDLDGTLIDSDEALIAPFVELGMEREEITFGHPIEEACRDWGIDLEEYVRRYDTEIVSPFEGAEALLAAMDRWGVCSNKHPVSGRAELHRLGWSPEVAMFSDAFGGQGKRLGPVLEAVGVSAADAVFVGDTDHDRLCAVEVGCRFIWAGWNPRTAALRPEGLVASRPMQVLDLLG